MSSVLGVWSRTVLSKRRDLRFLIVGLRKHPFHDDVTTELMCAPTAKGSEWCEWDVLSRHSDESRRDSHHS